ncbi:MAG TPA: hypothetical protein VLG76_07850 [Rhabdochlamydiaceae bacterium]|nr:hypothetical protein [Rhabdochlamydiaceae bacterium]
MNETNQVIKINITPATMDGVPRTVIQHTASFLDDKSAFVWMQTSKQRRGDLRPVCQQRQDKKAATVWKKCLDQGSLQDVMREIESSHPHDSTAQKVACLYEHVRKEVSSWKGGYLGMYRLTGFLLVLGSKKLN